VSFIKKSRSIIALLCFSLAFQVSGRQLTGPEIFKKQCAKCHGKNGEGVKGKFEGPLQGDRSLERLARYIERNMPDDKPGSCTSQNATTAIRAATPEKMDNKVNKTRTLANGLQRCQPPATIPATPPQTNES